jgi:hypothetical protein
MDKNLGKDVNKKLFVDPAYQQAGICRREITLTIFFIIPANLYILPI